MTQRFLSVWFAGRGYVLAALLGTLIWKRSGSHAPLLWEGLLPVALGMVLRIWAGAHLGAHGNAARAQAPALRLTGPYRFTRNPIYLANILVAAGLLWFANCLSPRVEILFLVLIVSHHVVMVAWEENHLRRQWGSAFEAFVAVVPRWLGWPRWPVSAVGASVEDRSESKSKRVWTWQGRNLFYAAAAALILWGAARWR